MAPRKPAGQPATLAQHQPFFARILALDLACPQCDTIATCRAQHRRPYDRYTATFRCKACGAQFVLGVLAYRATRYTGAPFRADPPADQIPSLSQSRQLRANLLGRADQAPGATCVDCDRPAICQIVTAGTRPCDQAADGPKKAPRQSQKNEPKPSQEFFRHARAARTLDRGGGLLSPPTHRHSHGEPTNRVLAGVCRCDAGDGDHVAVIAPDCPKHSVAALARSGEE